MAHKIKVDVIPHTNKDGSPSKTRKDYIVTDRTRQGRVEVGLVHNKVDLDNLVDSYRTWVIDNHLIRHPNDRAFRRRHVIGA